MNSKNQIPNSRQKCLEFSFSELKLVQSTFGLIIAIFSRFISTDEVKETFLTLAHLYSHDNAGAFGICAYCLGDYLSV